MEISLLGLAAVFYWLLLNMSPVLWTVQLVVVVCAVVSGWVIHSIFRR